jgi:hypothetical protein
MYRSFALSHRESTEPLHKFVTRQESPILAIVNAGLAVLPVIDKVATLGTSVYSSYFSTQQDDKKESSNTIGTTIGEIISGESSTIKDVATVSLSGYILSKLTAYTVDTFIQKHGDSSQTAVEKLLEKGWGFITNPSNNIKEKPKIEDPSHPIENKKDIDDWLTNVKDIPENNKSLLLIIVASLATFIHSLGALEMQRQIQRPSSADILAMNLQKEEEDKGNDNDKNNDWVKSEDDLLKSTKKDGSEKYLLGQSETFTINKQMRDIYKRSDFYTKQSGYKFSAGMLQLSDFSIVRVIFNFLVGLAIEIKSILGIYNKSDEHDHIKGFSQWVNMLFYWEILAHMLKIHGWAPIYRALQQIALILKSDSQSPETFPKTENKAGRGNFSRWNKRK